jgi:predicted nucleic acid-binding protein
LQEFYVAVTRKLAKPLPAADAAAVVRDLTAFEIVVVDVAMVNHAIARSRSDSLSFWDALIVTAAHAHGCRRLLSEDLQSGRMFGELHVENPFAATR